MSKLDFKLYSPEYNKPFSLMWALVDKSIIQHEEDEQNNNKSINKYFVYEKYLL